MTNTLLRTSLMTTLLFISHASYAEIYKWVDNNGKVHYSQTPPATTKVEDISHKIRMATGKGQGVLPTAEPNISDSPTNPSDTSTPAPAKNFCQQQQDVLQQLLSNPVVKWNDGKGEQLLNAQQRQAKIEEYEASVATACDTKTSAETAKKPTPPPTSPQVTRELQELLKTLED